MHVSALKIANVKTFCDGQVNLTFTRPDGSLPKWIVVAGRNGAGKTTLLQAVALSIVGPSMGRVLTETFAGWIRSGELTATVATKLEFSDEDTFAQGRRPLFSPWTALRWTSQPSGPEPLLEREITGGSWTPGRGPWSENPRGWFLAGYGPFRRLSPAPTDAQRMMMSTGRQASLVSLFREEASLSESILWLQQIYLRRLENKPGAETTEAIVLALLGDGLLPEGMKVLRVDSEGLWVSTATNTELPLRSLSDGYRTVAALVLDLVKQLVDNLGELHVDSNNEALQVLNEGVVLIDELDVHLHVSWQQQIGFWLKSHFPNLQFIVTTHSPFICQAADEGGLIRLPPPGSDEVASVVEGEMFNRIVNGSADDAVLSDFFGLETSYSSRSAGLRKELSELEAGGQQTHLSAAEKERLNSIRDQLPQTPSGDVARALSGLANLLDK